VEDGNVQGSETPALQGRKIQGSGTPALQDGEVGGSEQLVPLKEWLTVLIQALYDRIPEKVLRTYMDSKKCDLEGFSMSIHLDALEQPGEEKRLVTKADCPL
jgi:hypothetical protein